MFSNLGPRRELCYATPRLKGATANIMLARNVVLINQAFANQTSLNQKILDIEDLVKYGKEISACPYFLSKDSQDLAEIIFLPYNYLVDTAARKSQGVDLRNSVILFDEGHNLVIAF
jgi:Rad3-related DNA helicase